MNEEVLRARAIELIHRQRRVRLLVRAGIIFVVGIALGVVAEFVFAIL